MNKTTNIILIAILVVMAVGLVGILQKRAGGSLSLGSAGFNILPDGVTHTSVSISTVATGTTLALDANAAARYRRLQNVGSYVITCQLDDATSTLVLGTGILLTTTTDNVYEIGPDNLYQGQIRCLSQTSTGTISVMER